MGTGGGADDPAPFIPEGVVDPLGCTSWQHVVDSGPVATKVTAGTHGHVFAAGRSGDQAWVIEFDELGVVVGDVTLDPIPGAPLGPEVVIDVGTSDEGRAFVLVERDGEERIASLDVEAGSVDWDHVVDDSWLTPPGDWIGIHDMRQMTVTPSGRVMLMGRAFAVNPNPMPLAHTTNFVLFSVDASSGAPLWMDRIPALDYQISDNAGLTMELVAEEARGTYAARNNYVGPSDVVPTVGRYDLESPGPALQNYSVPALFPYDYNFGALGVGQGSDAASVMAWRENSPGSESALLIRRYVPDAGGSDTLDIEYIESVPQYELALFAAVVTNTGDAHVFARDGLTRSLAADGTMTSLAYPVEPTETLRDVSMMRGDPEALVLLLDTPAGFEVHQVCTLPAL